MIIKGILFDKDGTLIDFDSLWLTAARSVIPEFVRKLLESGRIPEDEALNTWFPAILERQLLESIGVFGSRVDSKGALAWKVYEDMAGDMNTVLKSYGINIDDRLAGQWLREMFGRFVRGSEAVYRPTANLRYLMEFLKKRDVRIGLATADTLDCAKDCLKRLGIYDYFDYIGADDQNLAPKPESDMFLDFARKFNLPREKVAVAGDTWNDMFFAKRCNGIAIGVLSGTGQMADFASIADAVLNSVGDLPSLF